MGRFNQLRDKFNNGELDPANHYGQIELVINENEKTRELTWGYNETYFNHVMEQNKQTPKGPGQVSVENLKKEIEGMKRPELGNYQEVSQVYQLEGSINNTHNNVQLEKEEEHGIDI